MRIAFFLNISLIILASVAATLGQELESVKLDEVRLSRTPRAKFALHPDGNLIAVFGVDNSVGLVDRRSQKIIRNLVGHRKMVRAAQFSNDGGALASGGFDKHVLLWSIPDGELTMKLDHHRGEVSSLTFDPTGSILASGSGDKRILMWDVATGDILGTLKGHAATVVCLSFDRAGISLFSGGEDGKVVQWSAVSREKLKTVDSQRNPVVQLAVTSDDEYLVTLDNRGKLRIRNLVIDTLLTSISIPVIAASSVAMAPDRPWMYTANGLSVYVWNVEEG